MIVLEYHSESDRIRSTFISYVWKINEWWWWWENKTKQTTHIHSKHSQCVWFVYLNNQKQKILETIHHGYSCFFFFFGCSSINSWNNHLHLIWRCQNLVVLEFCFQSSINSLKFFVFSIEKLISCSTYKFDSFTFIIMFLLNISMIQKKKIFFQVFVDRLYAYISRSITNNYHSFCMCLETFQPEK